MCGICGRYNYHNKAEVVYKMIHAMNSKLQHRGPNDEGYYINGNVGFAMRRLSIIDLSGGKQPIHNEEKTIWIVFNGEIFNYHELRASLIRKGHKFYTSSDTETIVHLYEEYGEQCVNFLRGMFAFAIWDVQNQVLFLARDRVGIKPLFYAITDDGAFVFASEIKSLLICSEISKQIDLQALDAYFTYGYIPAPLCIYKGIRKLLPGHWAKVSIDGIKIKKYWDLYFRPDYNKSESYFIERFEEIFDEAVRMRLMSEVPLGVFLSGGVDSSLVTAFVAKSLSDSPHTFTVGFSGDTGDFLDERPFARMIVEKYRCHHNEIVVTPNVNQILDEIVLAFDEPFNDDSVIPTYYICQRSKQSVTVALTGLGGDELFAGYERYLGLQLSRVYDHIPKLISHHLIGRLVEALPELKSGNYRINHLKRFVRASHLAPVDRYISYVSTMGVERRRQLYRRDVAGAIDMEATSGLMSQYYKSENADNPLDRALYQDIKTYLADDILTLTDRISMLHSQELRVPFTDHILMEFCATIPVEMKLKMFQKKYLLKKIAAHHIPKKVLEHRKQGFSSPMAQWLKRDLNPLVQTLLSPGNIKAAGLFEPQFVKDLIQQHLDRRELNDKMIFGLIIFQKWYERERNHNRAV